MEFGSPEETFVRLAIVGYQFPAMATEPYDSNWLNVKLRASGPLGSWSAVDPALLTYEAKELETWLRNLAKGEPSPRGWSALEPNLWMEWEPLGTSKTLRIGFGAEFLPPYFNKAEDSTPDEAYLDFVVDSSALEAAADALQVELARFPQRATV
jgi:hypothetical protein